MIISSVLQVIDGLFMLQYVSPMELWLFPLAWSSKSVLGNKIQLIESQGWMFHSYISICVFNLSTCFWCCFKILSVCASANVPSLVMFSTSFFCEKQKNIKNFPSWKNAPLECFEKSRATETCFVFFCYVDFGKFWTFSFCYKVMFSPEIFGARSFQLVGSCER